MYALFLSVGALVLRDKEEVVGVFIAFSCHPVVMTSSGAELAW
jgi:hypothetical protein